MNTKRFRMIIPLFFCVLLCGCHSNIIGNLLEPEHTELLVDGEYKPFNVPRNTMEALMKLVEAEDADTIYEVFFSGCTGKYRGTLQADSRVYSLCRRKCNRLGFFVGNRQRGSGVAVLSL